MTYIDTCFRCEGKGVILSCIDDVCRGMGECIHGNGYSRCPDCDGRGEVQYEGEPWYEDEEGLDEFALLDGDGGGCSESHTTRFLLHSSDYSTWECEADDCDALWYLEDGTPSENRMRYCPGCGRRIVAEVRDVEEQEAEDGEDDA